MYKSDELIDHLKTSHTIENNQAVYAEWNLNTPDNIERLGNYRYRRFTDPQRFGQLINEYDPLDVAEFYTGATDSDIVVDNGYDDDHIPSTFVGKREKMKLLYSLEDCIKPHRPRSGINKLLYLGITGAEYGFNQYIDDLTRYVARRPRYYMSSKFDNFKYWTSYRFENYVPNSDSGLVQVQVVREREYGISQPQYQITDLLSSDRNIYFIEDAAPFVVYKDTVPTNKIIIKMQTNVGEKDLGPFRIGNNKNVSDPLYGDSNKTTPKRWKIQVLKNNQWTDAISFDETSFRSDGSQVIKADGYVEIGYGLKIPSQYESDFMFIEELTSTTLLPETTPLGYAYLVKENIGEIGKFYIYTANETNPVPSLPGWESFVPEYGWELSEEDITINSKVVTKLADPDYFIDNNQTFYRELEFIRGIRIVVDTMNVANATFDLIEFSPRLFADITSHTISFSITKTLSDLGNYSIPVGNLIASVGQIEIFDDEGVFNDQNQFNPLTRTGSVISKYVDLTTKFTFFDIIKNVNNYDYYIPIKTLYSQGFPQVSGQTASVSINLRDFYFYLESLNAPQMLLTDVSFSYAVTVLLDSIGFTNYTFKRIDGEQELMIPFFFMSPDQSVAEVLQQLSLSTQSAMVFDEYNNLSIMSKNYIMANENQRSTDYTLYGNSVESNLPNIINIASQDKKVFNDGDINYTTRYIQRSIGSIRQAPYSDEYKSYVYKPVLLWEVEGQDQRQTINELSSKSQGYSLAAAPLNTDLSDSVPSVSNNRLINNIINLGENVYWLGNFSGYLYANGEIIKYDAIEYSVQNVGNVWISSNHEYQDYFANLKFNGKIYATGNVRIYSEPEYETVNGLSRLKNGAVKSHGRGQFGTPVVYHSAGLTNDSYWTTETYVGGCIQDASNYLFTPSSTIQYAKDAFAQNYTYTITNKVRTNNIATLTIGAHVLSVGDIIVVDLTTTDSNFEGVYTISNITPTTISYTKTGSNITSTATTGTITAIKPNGFNSTDLIQIINSILTSQSDVNNPLNASNLVSLLNQYTAGSVAGKKKNIGDQIFNADEYAKQSLRNGIIKNFLANVSITEQEVNKLKTTSAGTIQSSALIFQGPSLPDTVKKSNVVSYVYKELSEPYKHFGTRMRIVGKIETGSDSSQTPTGGYSLFNDNVISTIDPSKKVSITGGSGGIAFGLNKDTNNGYYFEIVALSTADMSKYQTKTGSTFFNIQDSPVVQIVNDLVTVSTETPHTFSVGDTVIVAGVFDDNKRTNVYCTANGEQVITAIGADRKTFRYTIPQPSSNTASIASATADGTKIVYTTNTAHPFRAGQVLVITGCSNASFNKTVWINSVNSSRTEFTITDSTLVNSLKGTSNGGTATYQQLNTISSSGGLVKKNDAGNLNISNIYFYKVVAGSNISEIIKKKRDGNLVTLTTLKPHSFIKNDVIQISNVDAALNGSFTITSVSEYEIKYNTATSGTIAETQLTTVGKVIGSEKIAIPQILWQGLGSIIVDDGKFTGQTRFVNTQNPTVYDLSVEYVKNGTAKTFYLYLNGKQIATVNDTDPLPDYKNMALFVRGSSKCMFENLYALTNNQSLNSSASLQLPISKLFENDEEVSTNEALRRYAISGFIQKSYLSGISSAQPPKYNMYFEEFGTIMRECAYFNIRYDRAFPALYAKLAPTINGVKGYSVSGFTAGSYGADFLVFNCIDKNLNLDDTTGNYLRILGISFTQNTTYTLSVNDYFNKIANLSDPIINSDGTTYSTIVNKEIFNQLKNSRVRYGENKFTVEAQYIQTTAAAEEMMDWTIKRVMYPKKSVGVNTFATSHLQLGDIVNIHYKNNDGIDVIGDASKRYVVYNIEYQKQSPDVTQTIHLAEI